MQPGDHNNDYFNILLQNAPDGLIIVDAATQRIIEANNSYCGMTGYSREELTRLHLRDIEVHDSAEQIASCCTTCIKEGTVLFEGYHQRKDGQVFNVEISATYVHYGSGQFLCICRDSTERKEMEKKYALSEEKYRALFHQSVLGIYLHDLEGNILEVNEMASKQSGFTIKELKNRSIFDHLPPSPTNITSREKILELWRSWPPGERFTVEADHQRKDGSVYPVEMTTGAIRFGDTKYLLAVVADITERKQFQESLLAERERLRVTLASIGDGVITTDTSGSVVLMNRQAETLTGWTQEEAEGKPIREVFTILNELTRESCAAPVSEVLKTGRIVELADHTVLVARGGAERNIADSGAPIINNKNTVIGVVLVFRDISEKQNLQETMQRMTRLESLGTLAGGIAHDFNNLLSGIFGNVDLARLEAAGQENIGEYLDNTLTAMERARDLTRQLLTFARGGAPRKKNIPVAPFLDESCKLALSGSNIRFRIAVSDNVDSIPADSNQLSQVLNNLLINARQAMPGGGTVTISASLQQVAPGEVSALPGGMYLHLEVSDDGPGIPSEFIDKIYDPFFTTKASGSGLGLSTSHSIIARHNGALHVDSRSGIGTTFHLYLPAVAAVQEPDETEETNVERSATKNTHKRVLIMDDEQIVCDLLSSMLEKLGFEVLSTRSGTEAFTLFKEQKQRTIDLVILDLTIPGDIGGEHVLAKIHEIDDSIPAIVASGYSDNPVLAHPEKYGFTARLKKPFVLSSLQHAVHHALMKN